MKLELRLEKSVKHSAKRETQSMQIKENGKSIVLSAFDFIGEQ